MLRRTTKMCRHRRRATSQFQLLSEHANFCLVVLLHLQLVLFQLIDLVPDQFHLLNLLIDLSFHLGSLRLYARWTGQEDGLRWGPALIAAILEPFTFQLFRHMGALLGWGAFLTGKENWTAQSRSAIRASRGVSGDVI